MARICRVGVSGAAIIILQRTDMSAVTNFYCHIEQQVLLRRARLSELDLEVSDV